MKGIEYKGVKEFIKYLKKNRKKIRKWPVWQQKALGVYRKEVDGG